MLDGHRPDRPPCDYWGTAEVTARLLRDLNCPDGRALWKCLGVDKCIHLAPRHPRAVETDWHLQSLFSIWGIATREVPYESGVYREVVSGPLEAAETPADVERFAWPDAEEWDLAGIREQALAWQDYPDPLRHLRAFLSLQPDARHGAGAHRSARSAQPSPKPRSRASTRSMSACSSASWRRPAT